MNENLSIEAISRMVVDICLENKATIRTCAALGISCEGWLKVELVRELAVKYLSQAGIEIRPEWNHIDIAIRTPRGDTLIELKTFPTNYISGGKPITNFVDGVAKDLIELAKKRTGKDSGYCIWLAYAIPSPEPTTWATFLQRIEPTTRRTVTFEKIPLWEKINAYLYVMESR